MSDIMGSAWALGGILGQLQGESEVRAARGLATALRHRFQQPQVQVDVNGLIEMIYERDELIADLEARLLDLQTRANLVEANRDKINAWAIWAEQKLKSVGAL